MGNQPLVRMTEWRVRLRSRELFAYYGLATCSSYGVSRSYDGIGELLRHTRGELSYTEYPSMRMAHRLLKNNGFAPAWIEEGTSDDVSSYDCKWAERAVASA